MTERLLAFTDEAWQDYLYWQAQDKKTLKRINLLIKETLREPFAGIGKPEALKANLVYAVDERALTVISCRYHYGK